MMLTLPDNSPTSGLGRDPARPGVASVLRTWTRVLALLALVLLGVQMLGADAAPKAAGVASGATSGGGGGGSVPAYRQARKVAIITIKGEIDPVDALSSRQKSVMAQSVARRIELAVRGGADALVFEIDTPGGNGMAALEIANSIRSAPVQNTVAWVHKDAISAGSIIALACREIVVSDHATFGDAMPILISPTQGARAPSNDILKKILPIMIADVLQSVRTHNLFMQRYDWDEYLAQAIVANDVELWLVENTSTGQRLCIDRAEFEMLFPGQSDGGPTRLAGAPGTSKPQAPLAAPRPFPTVPSGSKQLAMVASDVVQNLDKASLRPAISAADQGQWRLIEKVTDGTAPAVLKTVDMVALGFAANTHSRIAGQINVETIDNHEELRAFFGAQYVRVLDRTWSEGLVLFLTSMWVRGFLIAIFLICLFIEMTHPGVTLPGAVAALALIALLAPPLLIGMANWWEVGAILGGLVLIALEILVFPGFGIPGIVGALLLLLGLIGTFSGAAGIFPGSPSEKSELFWGMTTVGVAITGSGVAMYFIAKHFGSVPLLGRLVLKDAPDDEDAPVGLIEAMDEAGPIVKVGEVGTTSTPLRPSGKVQIGERVIDAVAELGYIPAGAKVRVTSVTPFRIGVDAIGPHGGPA